MPASANGNAECSYHGDAHGAMKKTAIAISVFALSTTLLHCERENSGLDSHGDRGVKFEIVINESVLRAGNQFVVKFLVTNDGEAPFYLSRHLSACGSALGFVDLKILDETGRNVRIGGCSDDVTPVEDENVLKLVHNSDSWIALRAREIYGGEAQFDLPRKSGTYELRVELYPTSLSEKQRASLAQNNIRVLLKPIKAPAVKIKVE